MSEDDLTQRNVIYGLYCECSECRRVRPGKIRYVGLTRKSARERLDSHLKKYREKLPYPVDKWKTKHGMGNIKMRILEVVPLDVDLEAREVYWVEHFKTFTDDRQGGLNRTRGGATAVSQASAAAIREANSRDGVSWAKLGRKEAREIREAFQKGALTRELAEMYGVRQGHIWDVIRNNVWVDPDYVYQDRPIIRYRNPENPSWAVTREESREIRELFRTDPDTTQKGLAEKYNVSIHTIRNVLKNVVWKQEGYTYRPKPMSQARRESISSVQKGRPKPEGFGSKVSQKVRGEGHGMGKLTEADVVDIRRRAKAGQLQKEIGRLYGIKQTQVSRIVRGVRWGHVREGLEA